MRIVGRDKISAFLNAHADARQWIENWIGEAERTQWKTPQDIKNLYSSASFLSGNVVIFNVKGNHYRMETTIAYGSSTVVVRWIGTHAEYGKR